MAELTWDEESAINEALQQVAECMKRDDHYAEDSTMAYTDNGFLWGCSKETYDNFISALKKMGIPVPDPE